MNLNRTTAMSRNRRIFKYFLTSSLSVVLTMALWLLVQDGSLLGNSFNLLGQSKLPHFYIYLPNLINLPGCNIPNIEPLSHEVKHLYTKRKHFHCPGKKSFITVVNRTTIMIDKTKLWRLYGSNFKKCKYVAIIRDGSNKLKPDDSVKFYTRPDSTFTKHVNIKDEFIRIDCYDSKNRLFHQEFKAFVIKKEDIEEECRNNSSKYNSSNERLNILVFGIDSISKLNFLRHFKKTYELLIKLDAIELHGYNKVQENTLVNMVPLLSGRYVEEIHKNMSSPYYDDLNLIWSEYANRGYRTLFAEDAPNIGMFNYKKKGFHKPPTHYYYRPLALALESSKLRKWSKYHCFGDKLEFAFSLEWIREFVNEFQNDPFFAWVFLSRLTHDVLNHAGYADEPSYNFIKQLYSEDESMNNTVLLFMSDHGIRFGDILKTYSGKLEERLPFMFLIFPRWFMNKYPKVRYNLVMNQRRLTTNFDIFETLKSILERSTGFSVENRPSPGTSLFEPLSENRTCEDLTITEHFCACHRYYPVPKNDSKVVEASNLVVKHLNELVKSFRHKCSAMNLIEILEASSNLPKSEVKGPGMFIDYRIVIKVDPSQGEFEATVRYVEKDSLFYLLDKVTRVNLYGSQSACLMNRDLAHVCFCHNQTTPTVSKVS